MSDNSSLVSKYFRYTAERFPLPVMVLYSAAFFYLAYFFAIALGGGSAQLVPSLLGLLVYFCSVFHLRIFDEHKDFQRDVVAYPDRMLSTGAITLAQLRKLMYALIFIEIAASLALGYVQLLFWALMFGYSVLMLFEFFAPEFLSKRIGLYLVTHQLIIPLYVLFGISIAFDFRHALPGEWVSLAVFGAGCMLTTMTFEIARKTWSPDREHDMADSYTRVWGRTKAVLINQLFALGAGACFIYLYHAFERGWVYSAVIGVLYVIFLAAEVLFLARPDRKNSKIVEAVGALYSMLLLVVSAVSFYFV